MLSSAERRVGFADEVARALAQLGNAVVPAIEVMLSDDRMPLEVRRELPAVGEFVRLIDGKGAADPLPAPAHGIESPCEGGLTPK